VPARLRSAFATIPYSRFNQSRTAISICAVTGIPFMFFGSRIEEPTRVLNASCWSRAGTGGRQRFSRWRVVACVRPSKGGSAAASSFKQIREDRRRLTDDPLKDWQYTECVENQVHHKPRPCVPRALSKVWNSEHHRQEDDHAGNCFVSRDVKQVPQYAVD